MKIRIVQFGPTIYKEAWEEFDAIPFGEVYSDFSYYFYEEFFPIFREAVDFERWPVEERFRVLLESGVEKIAEEYDIAPTTLREWVKRGIPKTVAAMDIVRSHMKRVPRFESYYSMGLLLYYEAFDRKETKRISTDLYVSLRQLDQPEAVEKLYEALYDQLQKFAEGRWQKIVNRYEDEGEEVYLGVVGVVAKTDTYCKDRLAGHKMFKVEVSDEEKREIGQLGYGVGIKGEVRRSLSKITLREKKLKEARKEGVIGRITYGIERMVIGIQKFFLRVIKDLFGG